MKKPRKYPETVLQIQVVNALRVAAPPDCCWFSVPNEGKRSLRGGARMKAMGRRAGAPDLIIIKHGNPVYGIELKAAKGVQSEAQKLMQRDFEDAGGVYCVVRSFDAALEIFRELGILC